MNERIIELADKAVEDISTGPWNISDEFCIKFAELIVRECAQFVEDKFDFCGDEILIAEKILEHFGVD